MTQPGTRPLAPGGDLKPWHRRLRHSLKWRLVALFLLLAVGVSAAFVHGTQKALAYGWRDAVRPLLSDYVDRLVADLGSPPELGRAQALVARLPISLRIEGPSVQFNSHPKDQHQHWQRGEFGPEADSGRLLQRKTADGHVVTLGLGDLNWRKGPGRVGWITLTALLALTAVAYFYTRRLLKPLDDIGEGVRRFGAGDFSQAITLRHDDELGELAGQINTMGQDIHNMLEAKRGLLLSISHELRSPLTRARLHTELLPQSTDIQPHRDALLRDLADMARLITDLLESERLASRHAALNLQACDLEKLVREVAAEFVASALLMDIPSDTTPSQLDAVRVRLALRNLVDNALRHNPAGAQPCEVRVRREGPQWVVSVRDFGPGVEASQLARLAQPFYRPDNARQRSTGGVGLGLYLCRLVAQAHGGSLVLSNASPGLRAQLFLPV